MDECERRIHQEREDRIKYHDDHYCVSVLRKYYEPSAFCSTDDGWPASKEPMEKAWRGAL